ncbi:uncharacterized protein LOC111377245 [Olea europaea var. sylvestris]|uniref:uncharacterized protein LOC111377245 n=1 Tax=Olea europaea var. sylvestris TaxID=158386 RepID=UPI000C1D83DD|nr:uncharacterized protein LOC111377245 [Olea europaea var. sylvestris]
MDLFDHLPNFVDLMRLYAALDAVMCRSFPPTLRREARDWSFVASFLSSKRKRKVVIGLMQVVQEKDESLQEYLARLSRVTLGIKDLQMSTVVTALMNGTRNRAFKMSVSKNPPELIHDLLKKGDKYFDAEEAEKVTKNLRDGWETKAHKRNTNDERRHADKNKPKNERMNKGYTQDWSVKQNKRNQSKYCHFHKDHGHDTEECLQLKEEIEHLLRWGLLAKYVKNDKGKERLKDRPPPRAGVINIIIGDVALDGDSNSDRKSYAHSVGICSIQKKQGSTRALLSTNRT